MIPALGSEISMGLAQPSGEWTVISHWVMDSKVHAVCGKGMSGGGPGEERCCQGRKEVGQR